MRRPQGPRPFWSGALLRCGSFFPFGSEGPAPLQPVFCSGSCVLNCGRLTSKAGTVPGGITHTPYVDEIRCGETGGFMRQSQPRWQTHRGALHRKGLLNATQKRSEGSPSARIPRAQARWAFPLFPFVAFSCQTGQLHPVDPHPHPRDHAGVCIHTHMASGAPRPWRK